MDERRGAREQLEGGEYFRELGYILLAHHWHKRWWQQR
jgi:hypothetical protein